MTALSTLLGGNRAFGRGYIDGLILANGTDADHDINIAAGECRDSTNTYNLINTATLVKQIDAAWAAGSAAGGLFSGAVANATWYHVFLIRKDSDGTIDAGFDTSVTAANKPAGYSTYRRIGSVLTNGSANILGFIQDGDTFLWKVQITDVNGASIGTAWSAITLSTPLGVKCKPFGIKYALKAATLAYVFIRSPDQTDDNSGTVDLYTVGAAGAATAMLGETDNLWTNTSSQLRVLAGHATTTFYWTTRGWIDPRGKDA